MAEIMEIQQYKLWNKVKDKRVPFSFDFEITARCNMNCRHCYINLPAGDREAMAKELTLEQIIDLGRQAVNLGSLWCLITGGEPLLRKDFAEIYLGLKRLGLMVSLFTNATLITEKHIELFKRYPPRDIEITVYGVTPETYEAITRRPGSYQLFMDGFRRLIDSGTNIRLKTMAIKSNLHEQQAIADFCWHWTKDYYRFDPQLHLRFDGDPARNHEIKEERLTPDQVVALETADEKRFKKMCEQSDRLINEALTRVGCDHLFHCGAGQGSFNLSYDGVFRLCSSLWAEGTTYDLNKGTLAEAWYDFVPKIRALRSQRPEFIDTCRKCALSNLCLWCPAHAHLENGAMDASTPYFCEVAHKRAEIIKGKSTQSFD